MIGRWLARSERERGTAIVELALVLPIMLLMAMGVLDFGRAIYVRNALANAARDGARFATIDPRNTACIQSAAAANSSLANLTAANVSITRPGTLLPGQPITVAVQSTYQPLTPLIASTIGANSLTLSASATMQIQNVPGSSLGC
jgi:Flp pilus assembly protein TadG